MLSGETQRCEMSIVFKGRFELPRQQHRLQELLSAVFLSLVLCRLMLRVRDLVAESLCIRFVSIADNSYEPSRSPGEFSPNTRFS